MFINIINGSKSYINSIPICNVSLRGYIVFGEFQLCGKSHDFRGGIL